MNYNSIFIHALYDSFRATLAAELKAKRINRAQYYARLQHIGKVRDNLIINA